MTHGHSRPLTVIILAGGLGKRMQSNVPKVLHPVHGEPMLIRILKEVHQLHPQRTIIIVNPSTHQEIKRAVQDGLPTDYTTTVEYVVQYEPRGTGHAIQSCTPVLLELSSNVSSDIVLVLSGDVPLLRAETMRKVVDQVNLVKLATTVLDNPRGYGRIITNEEGQFCRIAEERDCTEEEKRIQRVNCGIYAFDNSALCRYIFQIEPNNAQREYYLTDVVQLISQGEQTVVDIVDIPAHLQYQLLGVNTPEQLTEVEALAIVDPIPEPIETMDTMGSMEPMIELQSYYIP